MRLSMISGFVEQLKWHTPIETTGDLFKSGHSSLPIRNAKIYLALGVSFIYIHHHKSITLRTDMSIRFCIFVYSMQRWSESDYSDLNQRVSHTPHKSNQRAIDKHTIFSTANPKLSPSALQLDRKSTRLNSSHSGESRMPSSA